MGKGLYEVAGRDVTDFVEALLSRLEPGEADFIANLDPRDHAHLGTAYVMREVAPKVWGEAGTDEELLFFAVLATYGYRDDPPWSGCRDLVRRAFDYVHEIGEHEAAHKLRQAVAASAQPHPADAIVMRLRVNSLGPEPGALAAHEGNLAQGNLRDLRAANALDPSGGDPWDQLLP